MRRSSVRSPVSAMEQVSILIYLKLLDDAAGDYDGVAGRGSPPRTSMFQMQAERYRWRHWRGLPPADLSAFLTKEVLPYMGSLEREEPRIAAFFRDAELTITEMDVLGEVVLEIDGLRTAETATQDAAEFLDVLFDQLGLRGVDGQYRTSPALRDVMVRMTAPRQEDWVFDPAMGTAGLLVDAASHVDGGIGPPPALHGVDVSRSMVRIATVNLALRGLPTQGLKREDPLGERNGDAELSAERASVILCDAPFGLRRSDDTQSNLTGYGSRRLEALFLDLVMRRLAPGGRASVLVPDGILQDSVPSHVALRQALVERFDLLSVLSLPPGRFRAHAGLRSTLLTFRAAPRLREDRPDRVWFYRLGASARRRASAYAPEDRTGLAEFLRNWDRHAARDFLDPPGVRAESILPPGTRTPRSFWVTHEVLAASSFRLDSGRWAPRVADRPLDQDPEDLARTAIEDYRDLLAELEHFANELRP